MQDDRKEKQSIDIALEKKAASTSKIHFVERKYDKQNSPENPDSLKITIQLSPITNKP